MTRWFNDVWIEWLCPEPSSVTPETRLEDIKRSKDFLDSDILKWIWSNPNPITKEEWEKERIISVTNPNPEPNSNLPPVLDYHLRVENYKKPAKTIVIVSGYFAPLHINHIKMFEAAKALGDELFVIVNNDKQLMNKKGFIFQSFSDRLRIINSLKMVDLVIPSKNHAPDVAIALGEIITCGKPEIVKNSKFIFANGGDRNTPNKTEEDVCRQLGIEMVYNVGPDKTTSSTDLIERAGKWWASKYYGVDAKNISTVFKPRWD